MTSAEEFEDLRERLLAGDANSLAVLISKVENREDGYRNLMDEVYREAGNAWVLGITGSPGAGKSTLIEELIDVYRDRDFLVGVIAVDPSSPHTGGAVLGDRIRMRSTVNDDGVFCRSMSARGEVGGLSSATHDAVYLMDAYGMDIIIIETVGAGQSEVEIVRTADTVAVISVPMAGDEIQTVKAGILEIGDVFGVNKGDLDGAESMAENLRQMISASSAGSGWQPPVSVLSAKQGFGITSFIDNLDKHREFMPDQGDSTIRKRRVREDIERQFESIVSEQVEERLDEYGGVDSHVSAVLEGDETPYSVAQELLGGIRANRPG